MIERIWAGVMPLVFSGSRYAHAVSSEGWEMGYFDVKV